MQITVPFSERPWSTHNPRSGLLILKDFAYKKVPEPLLFGALYRCIKPVHRPISENVLPKGYNILPGKTTCSVLLLLYYYLLVAKPLVVKVYIRGNAH